MTRKRKITIFTGALLLLAGAALLIMPCCVKTMRTGETASQGEPAKEGTTAAPATPGEDEIRAEGRLGETEQLAATPPAGVEQSSTGRKRIKTNVELDSAKRPEEVGAGAPAPAPHAQPAGESAPAKGEVTSSMSIDDQHLYYRSAEKNAMAEKKDQKQAPAEKAKIAGGEVAAASPPASAGIPLQPGVQPFSGLKVVNDKPFHDMYFKHYGVNPTIDTEEEPFSTFSVDVDTASYTMARSYLDRGYLPEEDAIRVEEFINAFDYGYTPPASEAFAVHAEAFPSPNRKGYHVVQVGIKGKEIKAEGRKPANLVFVVDTSGSMDIESRLGLVKKGLGYLVDQLGDDDTVGIVAYGSHAYEVLRPTSGREKSRIFQALHDLRSTGSTNAQAGIHLGYSMAVSAMKKGGINRVILCSDGVANNGVATGADEIFKTVKDKADMGISISTIGFGMANYNDTLMERLADQGDGNYYYVDQAEEARRVFVENLTGMLQIIAKDVKIQVQFDPETVARYRLLGYENRALAKEDFANDKVDAGEIGAGHSVTAIYEVKFRKTRGDFATLRIRHKGAEGGKSALVERRLSFDIVKDSIDKAGDGARLALVASAFAEKLRGSYWSRNLSWDELAAMSGRIGGELGKRKEVVQLKDMIVRARGLDRRGDKYGALLPVARMDFDNLPIAR